MICLGVSPKKIKSNLKGDKFCRGNRGTEVDYSRNDFIQLKSLRERKRKLLLSTNSLVLDDAQSTLLLVDNLKAEKFDPVLIFKPMGIPDPDLDLDENIFMIGIQTLEQLKMMELCGRDILVIDATHDMTQYGCQLLNIMGVDEFNKGYPLAHCVSNKMDASTLQHFFRAIKLKCPTLQINCIITDDDPALINAANMGFGLGQIKHILCLWHFKRTLQRNLHAKVRNSSLEKEMFHHLCTIVDSEKEVEFHALVNDFQKKYENTADTKTFIEYFNKLCMSRVEKWAMYERKFPHKNVETTMYVVSFHNILKSIYLKRKPNKRIDTLVKLLLEVEEDAYARRTINNVRNEREVLVDLITATADEPAASHLNAMDISEENMTNIVANIHWRVKSESLDIEYDVQRYATSCVYPDWCYFKCISPLCQRLCSHMFVCTCPHESPLCKHIHKVHAMCVHNGLQQPDIQPLPSIVPSVSTPKPSQNNTKKLKDIGKELIERINENRIPQILIPHVTGVLSQLLAECRSVEESTNTEIIHPMVPTQKRSSTQKLTCQVLPKKKKKQLRKSNYPTAGEKRDIVNSLVQENSNSDVSDSDNELSNLIIEEEYYEES
ncbi:hypothetical protein WDU94_001812 [Cyamophila willieti]